MLLVSLSLALKLYTTTSSAPPQKNTDGGWLKLLPSPPHTPSTPHGGVHTPPARYIFLNHGKFVVNVEDEAHLREEEEACALRKEQQAAARREREEAEVLKKAEDLKKARFFGVRGEFLKDLEEARTLSVIGTKLVVDGQTGEILRLCDVLNSSQAAVLLQRNYRMRRSRMVIERKYLAEDLWR